MLNWLDFSGFGPALARFRRWLDKTPKREFSEMSGRGRIGRLILMAVVVGVLCAPLIWFFLKH